MKKVLISSTLYNLMLYLILFPEDIDETFYILGKSMDGKIKGIKYISIEKKEHKYKIQSKFDRIFGNYLVKIFFKKNKIDKLPVYGVDHWLWNGYIKRYHDIYLIEDGFINYDIESQVKIYENIGILKKLRWRLYWKKPSYGLSERVKKIYLTGLGKVPKVIENKVEVFDLQERWNRLKIESRKKITNIFNMDEKTIDIIEKSDGILITQPLFEDGVITEERKIEIYKNILKNYKGENIVIKPHPREITDYKKYFPEHKVINGGFPFELVILNGKNVKKLITIFSTGAMIGNGKITVDFYGPEVDKKIYERFKKVDFSKVNKEGNK
ncbi:glycosyltransferase family 52 [Cetobacterium ceti]